jgi:hypothetical protein
MKHHVILETCHRARDPALQQLVSEVQQGEVSDATLQLAHTLERDLHPDLASSVVHLFARNWECELHNGQRLAEILCAAEVFVSEDDGQTSKFDGIRVPRKLRLKACKKYELHLQYRGWNCITF